MIILDIDNNAHRIKPIPITKVERFRKLYLDLSVELSQEKYKDESLDIAKAYTTEPIFRMIIGEIMELATLDINKFPQATIFNLLFPHELDNGGYARQGDLVKFWLGESKENTDAAPEEVDQYAALLGTLAYSLGSFNEAVAVIDTVNYEQLEVLMLKRAELMKSPEEKARDIAIKNSLAAKEKLMETLESGGELKLGEEIEFGAL